MAILAQDTSLIGRVRYLLTQLKVGSRQLADGNRRLSDGMHQLQTGLAAASDGSYPTHRRAEAADHEAR